MEIAEGHAVTEIEIRSIGALLRRQSRVIMGTILVVFGLAMVFLLSVAPTYTATALVLIDPDNQNILNPNSVFPASSGRDNARVDSEVEILKSDAIAMSVVASEALNDDPEYGASAGIMHKLARAMGITSAAPASQRHLSIQTLARFKAATSIRRRGLTYLITVSTTSRSPARAADLANKLSAAYIEQQVQAKITRSLAARDVLNTQIVAAQMSLASTEYALDRFIDDNLDRFIGAGGVMPLVAIRTELNLAQARLQTKVQDQIDARKLRQLQNWRALGSALGDSHLEKLVSERAEMLQTFQVSLTAALPLGFQQSLAALDDKLAARSSVGLQALSAQVQDIDQNIAVLRGQMRRAALASDMSPSILTEIYTIQQETNIARTQYDNLLARLGDLETQAQIQIADSRIVSPALEPVNPTFPNRNLVLLLALAASMGIGVSLAFLKEYYIGGVVSELQLGELLAVTTAAVVPQVSLQNSKFLSAADLVIDAPLSVYAESVRKLRAAIDQNLRQTLSGDSNRLSGGAIILVTSALADEGKSTAALSLARTYAQAGTKTLLIDADLRRPSIHRFLGFEPQFGFLDYLRNAGDTEISGSFYARDPASSLSLIMGAGRSEYPTDQLLSSATFQALLAQAREVYGVIVIDSPPLLPVVDARYIAHYADAVALVVKWAATGQRDLKPAAQQLRGAMKPGAPLLPVLNQIQGPGSRYSYGGYADSYSAAI